VAPITPVEIKAKQRALFTIMCPKIWRGVRTSADRSEPCATSKEIVLRLTSNREYDLSQDSGAEVGFQRVPNPTIHDRFDGIVLKRLI
jgi:hypothetical protein